MSYATIINPAGSAAPTFTRDEEWVRNPFWEPIAHPSDERARALYQVDNGTNKLALTVTGGNFTVDWGDGSAPEDFTAGALAEHEYLYSDADLVGTEAPCTVASDVVTYNNHGLNNGDPKSIYAVGGGSVVLTGYVVNSTANTFQISLTLGGDPATIADGSYQLLSYRQAVVEVYPQAGHFIGVLDFNREPTGITSGHINKILELKAHTPNCTGVPLLGSHNDGVARALSLQNVVLTGTGGLSAPQSYSFTNLFSLVAVEIDSDSWNALNGGSGFFSGCSSLRHVTMNTANVTHFGNAFYTCTSLKAIQLDTSSGVNFTAMFYGCTSLESVSINTSVGSIFASAFYGCTALPVGVVNSLDFSSATDLSNVFNNCDSIVGDVTLNLPMVTNLARIFFSCSGLVSVTINSPNATDYMEAFENSSVTSVNINFADGCRIQQLCNGCSSLVSANLNACKPGDAREAFYYCTALNSPTNVDLSIASSLVRTFRHAQIPTHYHPKLSGDLQETFAYSAGTLSIEVVDASEVSALTNTFISSNSINSLILGGLVVDLNITSRQLGHAALVALFTSLGDVTSIGPKTVTVTGNPGVASLTAPDLAIATDKGWTVVT